MRLIPGKLKVKLELFKGVSVEDIIVGLVFLGLAILVYISNLPGRIIIAAVMVFIGILLEVRIDEEPNYKLLLNIFKKMSMPSVYSRNVTDSDLTGTRETAGEEGGEQEEEAVETDPKKLKEILKEEERILKSKTSTAEEKDAVWLARAKRSAAKKRTKAKAKSEKPGVDIASMIPYTAIKDDVIEYGGEYYGAVVEVTPIDFRFFSKYRRNNSIENCFGKIIRSLGTDYGMNIVKIDRPVDYDDYLQREREKLEELKRSYENAMLSEDELKSRTEIEFSRIEELDDMCRDNKVVTPFYYLVFFEKEKRQLEMTMTSVLQDLEMAELPSKRLKTRELAIFLKYNNEIDFNEKDVDKVKPEDYVKWTMPNKLQFKVRTTVVNDMITHNLRIYQYPSTVGDAWLAGVMSIPGTKVVIKCNYMDRAKAVRGIDHSLQELRSRYETTGIDSKRIELQAHIESLSELLVTLQGDNESLLETNVYITIYDHHLSKNTPALKARQKSNRPDVVNMKKTVRRLYSEAKFKLNNMDFQQHEAFIGSQISNYDPKYKDGRGMPSNTIAAIYPWIFAHISDKGGIHLGESDGVPVFIDFFRRDNERINSNMVIIGKSGSGKSYATKSLLANLAAEDAKIFILDPENEYMELAGNLKGKIVNAGNALQGRLNPFQIITALDDDEADEDSVTGSYATHLQFLEEFLRQIFPDCEKDALEYLNTLVERMYIEKGIGPETNLSTLGPEDYPIFDDLYDVVLDEFERTDNEYLRNLLRTLMNYVGKFATGGRNANIWNGISTLSTDENFTVFNFQSLLANRNTMIANAQMLLILKYIDNEIIKNRDYNTKYNMKRKIVVVIDEAHVFIDTKFPVALDFMFQLAKRIRKYNGMQIVITQNIKDFVGSEEIARKSTAIINACQYSFIFALAPNDITDLCKLYEKAGGINEIEQEQITAAQRGQAFTIMSATSRSSFKVEVPSNLVRMFEKPDYKGYFFSGEQGDANWEDFVSTSRPTHDKSLAALNAGRVVRVKEEKPKQEIIFEEQTEEEYQAELAAQVEQAYREENPDSFFEEVEESKDDSGSFFEEEYEEPAVQAEEEVKKASTVGNRAAMVDSEGRDIFSGEKSEYHSKSYSDLESENLRMSMMLNDMLGKFSYESLVSEIRRSVQAELAAASGQTLAADSIKIKKKKRPVVREVEPEYEDEELDDEIDDEIDEEPETEYDDEDEDFDQDEGYLEDEDDEDLEDEDDEDLEDEDDDELDDEDDEDLDDEDEEEELTVADNGVPGFYSRLAGELDDDENEDDDELEDEDDEDLDDEDDDDLDDEDDDDLDDEDDDDLDDEDDDDLDDEDDDDLDDEDDDDLDDEDDDEDLDDDFNFTELGEDDNYDDDPDDLAEGEDLDDEELDDDEFDTDDEDEDEDDDDLDDDLDDDFISDDDEDEDDEDEDEDDDDDEDGLSEDEDGLPDFYSSLISELDDEDEDDDEEESFDIMKLLEERAGRSEDGDSKENEELKVNPIDEMLASDQKVVDIKLDDLIAYIKEQKENKRKALHEHAHEQDGENAVNNDDGQ